MQAYYFAQKQDIAQHKTLFERIVVAAHQDVPGPVRAQRAVLLVGLPLTEEEESWFEECLLQGTASKLPGAKDSVLARRIATGKTISDTSALGRSKGATIGGINWDYVRRGIADAVPS